VDRGPPAIDSRSLCVERGHAAGLEIKAHEVKNVWGERAKPKLLRSLAQRWGEQSRDRDVLANSFRHGSDEKQVLRSVLFEPWVSREPIVESPHCAFTEREWGEWGIRGIFDLRHRCASKGNLSPRNNNAANVVVSLRVSSSWQKVAAEFGAMRVFIL
jgi:hypothetical protein